MICKCTELIYVSCLNMGLFFKYTLSKIPLEWSDSKGKNICTSNGELKMMLSNQIFLQNDLRNLVIDSGDNVEYYISLTNSNHEFLWISHKLKKTLTLHEHINFNVPIAKSMIGENLIITFVQFDYNQKPLVVNPLWIRGLKIEDPIGFNTECPICLEDIGDGEVFVSPCKHSIHLSCFKDNCEHLLCEVVDDEHQTYDCPLCRKEYVF